MFSPKYTLQNLFCTFQRIKLGNYIFKCTNLIFIKLLLKDEIIIYFCLNFQIEV